MRLMLLPMRTLKKYCFFNTKRFSVVAEEIQGKPEGNDNDETLLIIQVVTPQTTEERPT